MVCEEIFSINHAPLHWSLTNGADLENDVDRVEKLGQHDITSSTKNNMDALNYVGKLVLKTRNFTGPLMSIMTWPRPHLLIKALVLFTAN